MNLSANLRDTNLSDITLNETIDESALKLLMSSNLLKDTFRSPFVKYANEKKQLEAYKEIISNGCAKVKYTRKINIGRVNPDKSLGLHIIRREIRHTLARKYYYDIDVVNAHPVILSQICKHNNIECKYLNDYIANRAKYLKDVMDTYKVSRDVAKNLFIRLLYFGEFKFWCKDNKLPEDTEEPKFITKFSKELDKIGTKIVNANKELKKEIEKIKIEEIEKLKIEESKKEKKLLKTKQLSEFKEKGTIVSYFLQEKECQILECIFNHCRLNNIITDNAVLCNDGLMIPKSSFKLELIQEFEQLIKNNLGFDLKFEVKEMTQGYSLEELRINQAIDYEKISDYDLAHVYHTINPYKYIFSSALGWYEYNSNNVLEAYGTKPPSSLTLDISKRLSEIINKDKLNIKEIIIKAKKTFKPNMTDEEKMEYNQLIKSLEAKEREYNNAYKFVTSSSHCDGIIKYLTELYKIKDIETKIDANINLLAFDNCLYDYNLQQFRPIEPTDYISKTTKYSIDTKRNSQEKAKVINLVKSMFSSDEVYNYFMNITAISLFNNSQESLYIETGSGSNGKSVFNGIISKALGSYFYACENTFFTSTSKAGQANSSLINTKGCRYVSVAEPDNGEGDTTYFNIDFIKVLTGKDPITCRDLFKSNITFIPQFTPFLMCNKTPSLKRIDNGSKRRLKIVNFPFEFTDEPKFAHQKQIDRNLKDSITQQFINEFMHILIDIAVENKNKKIEMPESIKNETAEYFNENDPVRPWFDTWAILTDISIKDNQIKTSELHRHFLSHSDTNLSSVKFMDYLKTYNLTIKTVNGYKTIYGIKLKPEEVEENNLDI